jgi:hypothetical protein
MKPKRIYPSTPFFTFSPASLIILIELIHKGGVNIRSESKSSLSFPAENSGISQSSMKDILLSVEI